MIHERSDPESLAETALIRHNTKQFEQRLREVMKKRRIYEHPYRTAD